MFYAVKNHENMQGDGFIFKTSKMASIVPQNLKSTLFEKGDLSPFLDLNPLN